MKVAEEALPMRNGSIQHVIRPKYPHIAVRNCYVDAERSEHRIGEGKETHINDSLMYYHIAFNLTNGGESTKNEIVPINPNRTKSNNSPMSGYFLVNDSTVHCLRPGRVTNPKPLIGVLGCSTADRNLNSSCLTFARTYRTAASLDFKPSVRRVVVYELRRQ